MPAWDDVAAEVARRARPGDLVVTMGAPPISLLGDELLDALAVAATDEPRRGRRTGRRTGRLPVPAAGSANGAAGG